MDLIRAIEIFKRACPPICKYVQYHRKLKENVKDLKRVLQELNSEKKRCRSNIEGGMLSREQTTK